ncbi:uncharacterized protein LACBIDRAFT_292430 [Laccaria bicolor S238N-H82]|uniref:Sister chromatid cohesion protein n=1 Tax=Laccaria bicolor (strain S238N-H82 / ATCC MYA-4686) TaxID=486041 RepID=B0CX50_LACBS|nr:uncharacterized protein LACBIDRAFT_292430 [Laccaria bicolor S238N-H82]EDR13190.1 predicted protein [Laccaria bicolor S238N-H82]|eukprot:XP_001875688.1 predicted protein [Laccaria bicolor S238N-H82]
MDHNHHWLPQNGDRYHRRSSSHHPPQDPSHFTGAAADTVQRAQQLLAVYPMASATPTNHVARHISNMTLTAAPPTFVQPSYYSTHHAAYPPPYSEYDQQLDMFKKTNAYMRHYLTGRTRSYQYQEPQHWGPMPTAPSHFQTSPFAQSVFQRTAPNTAYPTPPPGITPSSSSLAYALGQPPPQLQSAAQPKVYRPEESPAFFNQFLEQKTREMVQAMPPFPAPARPTTPPSKNRPPEESPDPLALAPSSTAAVTPRKRKPVVEIVSPSKRVHSVKSLPSFQHTTNPVTPSSSASSVPRTPTTISTAPTSSMSQGSFTSTLTPKRVNLAYVFVPPSPYLTPFSSRKGSENASMLSEKRQGKMKINDTPNDLGGYGSDDDFSSSPTRGRGLFDSVKSSARRTGDRDERVPLEKLTALIDEIFEAEDALPADAEAKDLPPELFSHLSIHCSRPLLSPTVIRKLTKYIGNVARPTKRLRQTTAGGTPGRGRGGLAEVDTQILSRLLKHLDRSVKAGEDIDPFVAIVAPPSLAKSSPRKPSAKKGKKNEKRSKSRTPNGDEDEAEDADKDEGGPTKSTELNEIDFDKLSRVLDVARDSILAADCCIALLASDRLSKQLYSEELITACLSTIKNQLTKIVYPFVEASSETGANLSHTPLLQYVVKNSSSMAQTYRRQLSETFQALSAVLPRINALVGSESVAMSDSIIIQAVYIAIGPFFVIDTGGDGDAKGKKDNVVIKTLGKSAMRGLRLDALSLIRSIFANHEDQRSWIIEEILSSLIKLSDTKQKAGQFRLRDGRSIRTVSALLLQLVQTSAHDVRIESRRIEKARQNKFALRRQESFTESQQAPPEPFLDENDHEEIRLYTSGMESANKAAKTIILFLTQRSGKNKATKNSNEAEYRAIFDNLIEDLLVVLYWPEWPAAGLLLSIASKFMVASLDDVKSANSQTDTNAAKTIALDHLGVIAARIRSSALKVQIDGGEAGPKFKGLKPLEEVVSTLSSKSLNKLLDAHKDVASHLCKRSSEDQAYDSARELTAATLGQELASALKQVNAWIDQSEDDDDLNIKDESKTLAFGQKIKTALREVWKDPSNDVFDIGSQEEVARVDRLAEEIGNVQSLRNSFQPILNIILTALDAPAIFMRTKALRALGQIVTSDATILAAPNVRRGIESHLLDSSPQVRDAAVELIGKYMIDSPEVAGDYYQKIAERMADTGLGVRKRVIKLLKSFYAVTDDNARRVDIATRLVIRLMDEDESVKDLAIKTIEELWFPPVPLPSALKSRGSTSSNTQDKSALLSKVAIIMATSANFKDRQSPLEDVLHKIIAEKEGHEGASLHARYTEICETLIDGLVDASDLPGFTVINCIRTIYLFTSAYPSILSGSNASTLLPYLKNASTPEELITSDYLLKIFRVSIPHMPKTAAKFGQELQTSLQPMIIKPSGGGGIQVLFFHLSALVETVGCMCIVVQHLTHDFVRLVNLVKSLNARLQQFLQAPAAKELTPNELRALLVLILIVSLLGENCNFDRLRQENSSLAPDIDSISKGPITEHIYQTLLQLYNKHSFLFRAQPTLMTMESSAVIMDAIFASPEEEGRSRLLKIMQDFLISEASKHSAKEKESVKGKNKSTDVNMEELVGNTDDFADSGASVTLNLPTFRVTSAIVQRYLTPILDAALSQNLQIQATAIDVLSFTIKQGLAHPLQSFPVIVALETSPSPQISNRASALHSILHNKHASLLNTRYTVSARTSFDYQKKISSGVIHGFRVQGTSVALLQRWYSLVREKRPTRQDFLKSLVKVFQENPTYQSSQDDINFTRYMAENFSAFEYKTQEEVLTVIKYLTTVLSTTGMQLLEIISPSHLLTHLHGSSQTQITVLSDAPHDAMDVSADGPPSNDAQGIVQDRPALMRTSVIIAMVMLLKAYLKTRYALSEDKCSKFVVGKKSAIGDKPATKRNDTSISWDRLPFATTPLLTTNDADEQKIRFLEIWNEDGLTAEPDDDFL